MQGNPEVVAAFVGGLDGGVKVVDRDDRRDAADNGVLFGIPGAG